ncbi:MAG TPA: histidine kinase [Cyanothece sp. UBA12306]|nr:histidine kinase [Cyanothece sp. UBA12306]
MIQVKAVDLKVNGTMSNLSNRLFCRLNGVSPAIREQKRVETLKKLGLLEPETIPVFDEATQTAASFLETPICILGLMVQENLWLKAAVGLSKLGLMNQLASSRRISRQEAFSTYVVDSEQPVIIHDTLCESPFVNSILVQHYGIRAFLGSPLMTAEGQCIGAIAVMDLVPHQFTHRDVEFLTLTARWCLREFERNYLLKNAALPPEESLSLGKKSTDYTPNDNITENAPNDDPSLVTLSKTINSIKLKFVRQLVEEFQAPLTSIIGMSSILRSEVFGSLSNKQKEYMEIIYTSGQQMSSLVYESLKLGVANDNSPQLELNPVNIEMLAQQVLNNLDDVAKQKRQTLRLSVEPGERIWLLDKDKVRESLYYLVISLIQSSEAGGEIRLHISRRSQTLNIAVWLAHPWLGDGLPQVNLYCTFNNHGEEQLPQVSSILQQELSLEANLDDYILKASSLETMIHSQVNPNLKENSSQALLGLLLGCYLTESQGGQIMVQGSSESGYRYVLMLPKIAVKAYSNS